MEEGRQRERKEGREGGRDEERKEGKGGEKENLTGLAQGLICLIF